MHTFNCTYVRTRPVLHLINSLPDIDTFFNNASQFCEVLFPHPLRFRSHLTQFGIKIANRNKRVPVLSADADSLPSHSVQTHNIAALAKVNHEKREIRETIPVFTSVVLHPPDCVLLCAMTENQLVEIPQKEWSALQILYRDKKKEASSWNLLQNYIDWFAKDPTISCVKFFSLNGDWSDGTFVIQDGNTFMFNTLTDNQDRLFNALQCIDKVQPQSTADYNSLNDFVHRVKPTVDKFMTPIGINVDITAIWYHIPRDEALNFKVDPPPGVTVAPLTQDNVEYINNLWHYHSSTSAAFISRLIRFNLHAGAFDGNGRLLAWCIQMPMGFIGILQVRDDQRRRGFGSLVVRAISKKFAERGIEVTASVVDDNAPSRSMFEKLGFKEIDQVHWVRRPRQSL